MENDNTNNIAGAVLGAPSAGYLKINKVELVEMTRNIAYEFLYYYLIEEHRHRNLILREISDARPECERYQFACAEHVRINFTDLVRGAA